MPRITCPTCGAALDVTPDMIGETVECGSCQAHFVAREKMPARHRAVDDEDRPSRRDEEEDRPSRRRRDEEEDDYDDRPRRRRRRTAPQGGTGMATASLVLGIVSVIASVVFGFCCPLLTLPPAVLGLIFGVLGMKTEGRGMAIGGLIASVLAMLITIGWVVANLVLGVAMNAGGPMGGPGPGPNNNPPPWNQPKPPPPPQPPRFR